MPRATKGLSIEIQKVQYCFKATIVLGISIRII
jgi:hypothetical protein